MSEYVRPDSPEEVIALRRHIREAHPNLLGDPSSWVSYAPLPERNISRVPAEWLYAIHDANHRGLYREHLEDQWLPPKEHQS